MFMLPKVKKVATLSRAVKTIVAGVLAAATIAGSAVAADLPTSGSQALQQVVMSPMLMAQVDASPLSWHSSHASHSSHSSHMSHMSHYSGRY